MNLQKQISGLRYRLNVIVEELKELEKEVERQRRNVRLTKAEANRVMGYKDPNYIYRLSMDSIIDEDGFIWYNDLWEWASEHKSNRLKYMKNNIKEFIA